MTDRLPLLDAERNADVAGDRVDVDRGVGRTADRRVDHDRVLECLPGQDVGGLEVLLHHLDDALPGQVGHPAAVAVGRRDRRRAGKAHAERLGEAVHRRGRPHGVAVARRRRGRRDELDELSLVDLTRREHLPRPPDDRPRAGALPLEPAVEHRSPREDDGREVHRGRRHDARRGGLVAAGGEDDAVERVTVEDLHQTEVGQVAVEGRGRPLPGFLDGMHGELERDPALLPDPLTHPVRQLEMVSVARRKIRAGLRDADDRPARLQLLPGEAPVHVPLDVERGHSGIVRVVEPGLAAQPLPCLSALGSHSSPT